MDERLWKFAMDLPSENKFQAVLKSALFKKAFKYKLDPADYSAVCSKCLTPWQDGYFSVVYMPPRKRYRAQIEKYACMGQLTRQQKSLKAYLQTRERSVAKYTCEICSFKTLVPLDNSKAAKLPKSHRIPAGAKASLPGLTATQNVNNAALQRVPAKKAIGASNGQTNKTKKTGNPNNKQQLVGKQTSKKKGSFSRKFEPQDFRAIQKMLAAKMSAEASNKSA